MDTKTVSAGSARRHLLSVPLEVLLQITSNLTTPEYGNLRQTCKHIESTLFNAFSREFFTKRQFMLTDFSLQALLDISKSRLSSTLSHVIVGLERPSLSGFPQHSVTYNLNQTDLVIRRNRLLGEYLGHTNLLSTGQDVELLAEAFSNLSNLETIGIRDFYSRSRNRDSPNVEWRSYGVSTYVMETGGHLEIPQRTYHNAFSPDNLASNPDFLERANYLSRIFLNLLRALGKADSKPTRFEVILRKTSLQDHAFNIPKYAESIVRPVLANIRTLFLDLHAGFPDIQVDINGRPTTCSSYFLRKFLSRVPQLEHLRLNFSKNKGTDTNDFLLWLSQSVPAATAVTTTGTSLPAPPLPVNFTSLQELDIGMLSVEPKVLLVILRKHQATLRSISFHKVSLLQTGYTKSSPRVNLWAKFFDQLSKLSLNLSAMNMSSLSQQSSTGQHIRPVLFKDSKTPEVKKWASTDISSGLRDFISLVFVGGLEKDSDESLESNSEDSDDSMDDDAAQSDDDGSEDGS